MNGADPVDLYQLHISSKLTTANTPITLLGDSWHPMSPFKAQGANQALIDVAQDYKEICVEFD